MAMIGARRGRSWQGGAVAGLCVGLLGGAVAGLCVGLLGATAVLAEDAPPPQAQAPPDAEAAPGPEAGTEASAGVRQELKVVTRQEASPLGEATRVRQRANQLGIETQQRIDTLSDKTDEYYARYTAALSQLESLRSYNGRMRELVASQESELDGLRSQLDQVEGVGRSVAPLMLRMIESLEEFVELDVPFLLEERRDRVAQLRRLLIRADVSLSEKFRRIMEAYQIETEYGRTIEAYRGPIGSGDTGRDVDFLRFGRVALVYLTLDEQEAGAWDARSRSWQPLGSSYIDDVRQGLRIARKQIAPDLIDVPLPEASESPGSEG